MVAVALSDLWTSPTDRYTNPYSGRVDKPVEHRCAPLPTALTALSVVSRPRTPQACELVLAMQDRARVRTL